MDELLIRFATADDIEYLQRVDNWPKPPAWLRKIDAGEVLVAEWEGLPIGSLRFEFIWTTVPFISLACVDPDYRKRGVSRAMLEFLISHLRSIGHVALLSSSQSNKSEPNAWHLALGFRPNGVIENIADDGVHENIYRIVF